MSVRISNERGRESMGRRLILLLSAMATMVVVSAGVALAAVIIGTNANDNCAAPGIVGQPAPTAGVDDITLADGADICNALGGADLMNGDSGGDTLNGGGGGDQLYSGGGIGDTLVGGGGGDFLSVVDGDDGAGNADDQVSGGAGADVCAVDDPAAELADATCETVLHARP
jgi:Ca2+-binding RTX toxin-like protein